MIERVSTAGTRTFKLVVAYDGARFKGWQRGNGRTVQSTLEAAVRASLATASGGKARADEEVRIDGSGRTDAGVHAEVQVASVVLPDSVDPTLLFHAANRELPADLALVSVEPADDRFHARYSATAKTYRYRIVDGPVGDPFLRRFSWRVAETLDVKRMRAASEVFIGTHDFSAFTADRPKPNKLRTIHTIRVERTAVGSSRPLEVFLRGDGFLWKQVRIMVSALVAAGTGDTDASSIEQILVSRDRSLGPPPAPASGLTLVSVEHESP